jgi:tetratricopeptide (TPR) repeat protein
MDVDRVKAGDDFVEAIETSVASSDVLIAVIGMRWLDASDQRGKRRLDDPEDFVRLEISVALRRRVRVVPVLLDGALMPRASELPTELQPLVRRHAVEIRHNRFEDDSERLVDDVNGIFEELAKDAAINVSSDPKFYLIRGSEFSLRGEYDKAISNYTEAIRLYPDYVDAYNRRGLAYICAKDYGKANSDFSKAIELDPKNARIYYNRGISHQANGKSGMAQADFANAINRGFTGPP